MGSTELFDVDLNPLIQQMVVSVTDEDSDKAIEDALRWLRQQCRCERAMFYQFRGALLLTCITSNVNGVWEEVYRHGRMIMEDPVIKCFRRNLGFMEWGEAFARHPPTSIYRDAANDCGMMPGFSYGYCNEPARHGVISVCSLNGMQRSVTLKDRYLLTSLVPVLHMTGKVHRFRAKPLTQKELEILKWVRAGKTAWEIGLIREVSESTVKYHLKSIYNKLGVSNRAQAIGEALCKGMID